MLDSSVKKDCFAYSEKDEPHCICLNQLYCEFENCKFYKKEKYYEICREM